MWLPISGHLERDCLQARRPAHFCQMTDITAIASQWRHAFTLEQLSRCSDPPSDTHTLEVILRRERGFVELTGDAAGEKHFIASGALLRWFTDLSMGLAKSRQFRMDGLRLASSMNSLRPDGQWQAPPPQAVRFGQSYGFVGPAWNPGHYFFPLAHILSFLPVERRESVSAEVENLAELANVGLPYEELALTLVEKGFSPFRPKVGHVVRAREGLLTGTRMTLQQVSDDFGVTRGRIHQIETEFREKIERLDWQRCGRYFDTALLGDVMLHEGSLIIRHNSSDAMLRKFIAKCSGVPHAEVPKAEISVLGASQEDLSILRSREMSSAGTEAEAIAAFLESTDRLRLIQSDLRLIAEKVARLRPRLAAKDRSTTPHRETQSK